MATQNMEEFKFPDEQAEDQKLQDQQPEIEIEIEDDTPEEDRDRQPMPKQIVDKLDSDELSKYDEEVQEKLKQARKIYHDERREKERILREQQHAIEYAKRLRDENEKIKNILQNGERQYVESVNTTAELQLKMAEQAYKEAYESGDSDKIVEANKALQQANLQAFQARNIKLAPLQEQKYDVQPEPEQRQQPVQTPKPDEKALSWQKRNPWFGEKRSMTAYAYGVHDELRESGVVVGSDRYYSELDKAIRKRFPEEFGSSVESNSNGGSVRRSPSVVAPALRSTASNKVKLKTSELNLAKKFGLTPEQYALEKKKLENVNG